jgi:hypothetical protein
MRKRPTIDVLPIPGTPDQMAATGHSGVGGCHVESNLNDTSGAVVSAIGRSEIVTARPSAKNRSDTVRIVMFALPLSNCVTWPADFPMRSASSVRLTGVVCISSQMRSVMSTITRSCCQVRMPSGDATTCSVNVGMSFISQVLCALSVQHVSGWRGRSVLEGTWPFHLLRSDA